MSQLNGSIRVGPFAQSLIDEQLRCSTDARERIRLASSSVNRRGYFADTDVRPLANKIYGGSDFGR